ncbi:MAG TPA: class I SAM-dependent methyltransferase [Candidatus Paceibacterota bacterium]
MTLDIRQQAQEDEYSFPYHHLVQLAPFSTSRVLFWGLEYAAYITLVLDELSKFPWSTLLEVGCGDGKFVAEAARRFPSCSITGADFSERAILFARAFNYGNGAEFFCGDIRDLNRTFETVVLIETLEHIPEVEITGFVETLRARLEPGSTLIVTVPTTNIPLQSKHYRHYTLELLEKQLTGFSLVHARYAVKTGLLRRFLFRLTARQCGSVFTRFAVALSRRFLVDATATNGRHIVAVFSRT